MDLGLCQQIRMHTENFKNIFHTDPEEANKTFKMVSRLLKKLHPHLKPAKAPKAKPTPDEEIEIIKNKIEELKQKLKEKQTQNKSKK